MEMDVVGMKMWGVNDCRIKNNTLSNKAKHSARKPAAQCCIMIPGFKSSSPWSTLKCRPRHNLTTVAEKVTVCYSYLTGIMCANGSACDNTNTVLCLKLSRTRFLHGPQ